MSIYVKQDLADPIQRIHCSFLDKILSRDARVLIIGCGYGIESSVYANSVNLDIDMDCLKFCNKQGISNLINASADYLPFKSCSFDYILLQDVIEHFPSKKYFKSVILELTRILNISNTKIIVVMPLKDNLTAIKKIYNKMVGLPIPIMAHPGHTLHLSRKEIIRDFMGYDVILDDSQKGAIFGIEIIGIGGGYAYICMEKI